MLSLLYHLPALLLLFLCANKVSFSQAFMSGLLVGPLCHASLLPPDLSLCLTSYSQRCASIGCCFSQGFVSAALGQNKGCLCLTNELGWPPQVGQTQSEGLQTAQSTARTSECRLLRKRGLEGLMGNIIFSSSWLMNAAGPLGQEYCM